MARALPMPYGASRSVILYRGPSAFDGRPIAVILTGLRLSSSNGKTGAMAQTFIIPDDEEDPYYHVKRGDDRSVCGSCAMRGGHGCYVRTEQAPTSVWRAMRAGAYDDATHPDAWRAVAALLRARGLVVRAGSYGDPAAAPADLWQALPVATGYTHAWRRLGARHPLASVLMASADGADDARAAHAMGWRTFTVSTTAVAGSVECPATTRGVSCADCRLCGPRGMRARSIWIQPHGARARAAVLASSSPIARSLAVVA